MCMAIYRKHGKYWCSITNDACASKTPGKIEWDTCRRASAALRQDNKGLEFVSNSPNPQTVLKCPYCRVATFSCKSEFHSSST